MCEMKNFRILNFYILGAVYMTPFLTKNGELAVYLYDNVFWGNEKANF